MGFNENIANIRAGIAEAARAAGRDPADVTLLAATKTRTSGEIRAAIAAGKIGRASCRERVSFWV